MYSSDSSDQQNSNQNQFEFVLRKLLEVFSNNDEVVAKLNSALTQVKVSDFANACRIIEVKKIKKKKKRIKLQNKQSNPLFLFVFPQQEIMKDPLRTKEEIDSYSVIWAEAQNFGKQQSFGMADNSQSRGDVYQSRGFPPGGAPRRGGYGGGVKPAAMGGAYGGGYGGGMGNYYNYPNNM